MKYLLILLTFVFFVGLATTLGADDQADSNVAGAGISSTISAESGRVYPIAPGVWYPGDPLPEKPMRYYRVRCWPGCHRGSSHGMYPEVPLDMKPIYPTSTINNCPPLEADAK